MKIIGLAFERTKTTSAIVGIKELKTIPAAKTIGDVSIRKYHTSLFSLRQAEAVIAGQDPALFIPKGPLWVKALMPIELGIESLKT